MISRRSSAGYRGARGAVLVLLVASSLAAWGCTKGDSGKRSGAGPSAAPTATVAVATNDLVAKLPVYSGAALATTSTGTISGKHVALQVYTTKDPFDQVYKWYQNALPAHSETSHDTSQSQESAVFTLSGGTTQQSVSILKTEGVEVVNITLTVASQ